MPKSAKFTDITIRSLPEGLHFDARTPGFGIRVGKNRRTWLVVKGASRTKVRLGHYPQLSLQDARKKALVALGSPMEPTATPTFPEALNAFLAQDKWRGRSKYVLEQSLRRHFHWTKQIDKVTPEDVSQVIDGIKAKSSASHALKDIRTFFSWCVPRYIRQSPATGLKMPRYVPRERVLSDEELKAVWHAADGTFGFILRLLILTGARRSEISRLQWKDVAEDRLTFPETKNGRSHTVPIGAFTKSILRTVERSGDFLFPGRGSDTFQGFATAKAMVDRRCPLPSWTIHDLRRTFATNLAALGTPIHVTEKLLNHVSGTTGGIVAVYQRHAYWDEQVAAIKRWEDRLQEIIL